MRHRRFRPVACGRWLTLCASLAVPIPLLAQQPGRNASVRDLPRPGLEAPPLRVGAGTLRLEVDAGALYDNNVYATKTDKEEDVSFRLQPRAELSFNRPAFDLSASAQADALQHLRLDRESNTQFGGGIAMELRPAPNQAVTGNVRFDRSTENRTDPDARAPIFVSPRKINTSSGQLGYRYTGGTLRIALNGAARKIDYLDPAEGDRDHRAYEGSLRLSWAPRGTTAIFVEGFAMRRDFRLARDFSGVDRDATTYGANIGVSREVTARLNGSVGVGIFHFEPDDPTLESYNGLGFGGWINWTPRPRTAVALNLFRGDVATIRSGATGRTDTRVSLHIDQEVRHNLILSATASWLANKYRGAPYAARDTFGATVETEYLLSPRLSLYAAATLTKRNAKERPTLEPIQPTDDFTKAQGQIGLRLRF